MRFSRSPPARVAWIETFRVYASKTPLSVATREGGVDRNVNSVDTGLCMNVATREGGVDRNITLSM